MRRYFRALWLFVTGRFSEAAKALQSNQYVMAATYDQSIKRSNERFETVKNAVANLITISDERKVEIKGLGEKVSRLTKIKVGAQGAMQTRINHLLTQGLTKEQIETDAEFIKHKAAFLDVSSTLEETTKRMDEKEDDLKERLALVERYKVDLQSMQRQAKSLAEEKEEAIADVGIAKQQEQISAILNGIPIDSTDKDLAAARQARQAAKAKAKISQELSGNDVRHAESEYLKFANDNANNSELDKLLNWGDESKTAEPMQPAKLPS